MGKASKFKRIRKIASQMPVIEVTRPLGEKVTGSDVIKSGVKELKDGTAIDPHGNYKRNVPVKVPLNHNKNMKRLYNKGGAAAVGSYIGAVQTHVAHKNAMQKKQEENATPKFEGMNTDEAKEVTK